MPAPSVVTVHARDFSFDAPDSIVGGTVTFRFINDGPQFHHVSLIRLTEGKTVADFLESLKNPGPPPAWAIPAGGPNVVDAGHEITETMSLPPGDYAIVCFVDTPDRVPHLMKGMTHTLRVLPPPAGASPALPAADLTITLSSYAFTLSDSVTAGPHTLDVVVTGNEPHELAIFRLLPGKTTQDLTQWLATYQGELPATVLGGTAAALPGVSQRVTVDFTPGEYVLMCFVPAPDGKPHMAHGMVRRFTVT